MVSSAVWISDLNRFNAETGLAIRPYPLAAYACMSQIAIKYGNLPVTAVLLRPARFRSRLLLVMYQRYRPPILLLGKFARRISE